MAIKFGSDGTLYCNTIKYNYKQCVNLVPDGCFSANGATWSFSNCSVYNNYSSCGGSHKQLVFQTGSTAMATCPMPTPIANHKYYGGCVYSTESGYSTAGDARFEWFLYDGQNLVFGQKTANTGGTSNFVKISAIVSLSSVASGSWIIRNFVVNGTSRCLCTKMMIVDLTDAFGSGKEPTKAWCDENILEWSRFFMIPLNPVIKSGVTSAYTGYYSYGDYGNTTSINSIVRDYYYYMQGTTSSAEVFLNSGSTSSYDTGAHYYGMLDVRCNDSTLWNNTSMDLYFPVAEPLLGQTLLVNPGLYNSGGGAADWKRCSMMRPVQTKWSSGSYSSRVDFNNSKRAGVVAVTNIWFYRTYYFYYYSKVFDKSHGGWTPDANTESYNKPFMDRWCGGQNPSIIHVPNPANKTIKFNTNYDIVCNDILPDPGETKIWFDTNGRVHCKKLVTDKVY